ncbi:MAG TPA: hypothetical protein VM684_10495 [Gaiellales bacterium]|jgi:hypothetical protein|nr:hypothetical protein [Gaiellales bacterium]
MDAPGQLPDDHLILDEVTQQLATTFQLLSGDPDEAAERALAEIGVDTRTEAALLGEIAAAGPLAHPDRFEQSHRLVMRALEVLDRDGWKHPVLRRLGPFSGAAAGAVQFVARTIVRGHVANVVRALSRLYARRESQSQTASAERRMLARARIQADRLALGYKGGSLPLPTVLIGGAAVPVLASIARQFGAVKGQGPVLVVPLGVILAIVFAVLAWVLLQGAGLAHRRIKVTLDPSLAALYETIGHCGNPPQDDSAAIAAAAIALTALAWFVVPIAIAIIAAFL